MEKQVAEVIVKRCLPRAVVLLRIVLNILSFRLGTLLLCGFSCLDWRWPFILKFSDMSLEKREEILKSWTRKRGLLPLRLVFVVIKIFCLYTFFSMVILFTHYAMISPLLYFSVFMSNFFSGSYKHLKRKIEQESFDKYCFSGLFFLLLGF